MTHKTARTFGILLLVILLALVGLVPSVVVTQIADDQSRVSNSLVLLTETAEIDRLFQIVTLRAPDAIKNPDQQTPAVLNTLETLIQKLQALGEKLTQNVEAGEIASKVEGYTRGAKLLRLALFNYRDEHAFDPTSDMSRRGLQAIQGWEKSATEAATALTRHVAQEVEQAQSDMTRLLRIGQYVSIIGLVLGLSTACIVGLLLTRSLKGPIQMLTKATEEVMNGNLTFRIDTPAKDEIGRLAQAFNSMIHGLAEKEKMQKELHVSQETTFALLNATTDMAMMQEMDGTMVEGNEAFCRSLGLECEDAVGQPFFEFLPASLAESRKEQFKEVIRTAKSARFEDEFQGRRYANSVYPILDEFGKVWRLAFFSHDVTDMKQMEAKIREMQKLESIGTLAGGIAHDFNNLLMVIMGNTSLILSEMDPIHPHYTMLESIEVQAKSGAKLTSQLLGYARKGRYSVKPLSLNALLDEICDTFGRTRKEIVIRKELRDDLAAVEADEGQIKQVLLNLFVNAADAMPHGGEIFVWAANATPENMQGKPYTPKPGPYVRLGVGDTGVGMDKKTMERIFDPFFTTKEMGRGTGLGLASAFGIIKGHGGYIDVESQVGQGTVFTIFLPASDKAIEKGEKPDRRILKQTGTVLLVDDEKVVLNLGAKILSRLGYRVLTAAGGREAIALYETNREGIDLVILDMIMPGMNGGETFDRLKERNPHAKVLLSSGYSIDGEAKNILARGCCGFIQKPFTINEFSETIHAALDGKSR